jgi:hypothetical protein
VFCQSSPISRLVSSTPRLSPWPYCTVYVITWNCCAWYCSADVYRDDDMIDDCVYMKERRGSIYVLNARHQVWLCWDIPHRGTYCLGCSWNIGLHTNKDFAHSYSTFSRRQIIRIRQTHPRGILVLVLVLFVIYSYKCHVTSYCGASSLNSQICPCSLIGIFLQTLKLDASFLNLY